MMIVMKKNKTTISQIPVLCAFDEMVDIEKLQMNPRNPKQHPEEQIRLYAKAIAGNGWRRPVTVSNLSGMITRGHGALLAARLMGLSSIPVDYQDYDNQDLEMADVLADNRIGELGKLDELRVQEIILSFSEHFDLDLTGFDSDNIQRIIDDSENTKYLDSEISDPVFGGDNLKPLKKITVFYDEDCNEVVFKMFNELSASLGNKFRIVK